MEAIIKKIEPPEKILAHLLQGVESKILEIVRIELGNNILLLQHDGFTCAEPVDARSLETMVLNDIGYSIEFSEELLQMPADL